MYQPARASSRPSTSAASSSRTAAHRASNERDEERSNLDERSSMSRAISDSGSDMANSDSRQTDMEKEIAKLNQITQVRLPSAYTETQKLCQSLKSVEVYCKISVSTFCLEIFSRILVQTQLEALSITAQSETLNCLQISQLSPSVYPCFRVCANVSAAILHKERLDCCRFEDSTPTSI
jgi:hypothetical protein